MAVVTTTTDASVVATRDATGTIRLAIGRHTGCDRDIDAHCPDLEYGPDATLQPVVPVPSPSGRFSITTVAVPSADGEIPAPVPSASRVVEAVDGVLDLGPIELPDGDAVFVVITPV